MSRADRSNSSESRHTISTESRRTETDDSDSDLPPDSIVIPFAADGPGWRFYDSGESTREITNPKSHSDPFPIPWSKPGSNSNRVAAANLSAPAPIMGIPAKIKLPAFARSQGPPSPSIFPRWRNSSSKKSAGLAYSEPGSPKVSCWGKVVLVSERDKLQKKLSKQSEASPRLSREPQQKREEPSCCHGFSVVMSCVGHRVARKKEGCRMQSVEVRPSPEQSDLGVAAEEVRTPPDEAEALVASRAAGLGVLGRLSSNRRGAASWGGDVAAEKEAPASPGHNNKPY